MRTGRIIGLLGMVLAAALVCAPRAAAQEASAEWEPVEFRWSAGSERWAPADSCVLLVLVSRDRAVATLAGDEGKARGSWSLVRGPAIRFVGPRSEVRTFTLNEEGARGPRIMSYLRVTRGAAWHAAALADPRFTKEPDDYLSSDEQWEFTLHEGGAADHRFSGETPLAGKHARDADGNLVLTLAGGSRKTFRGDGPDWVEVAGGARYFPARERRLRGACILNALELSARYITERFEEPGKPKFDGIALPLSWRRRGRIKPGEESLLRCPADPLLRPLDEAALRAYDEVDPQSPPDDLCSYSFRDFARNPMSTRIDKTEIVFCCRQGRDGRTPHHRDGVVAGMANGTVRFLRREALGLAPDDPIVVGPDSKSELLKPIWVPKQR